MSKQLYVLEETLKYTVKGQRPITVEAECLGGMWHVDGDGDPNTPDTIFDAETFTSQYKLASECKNEDGTWKAPQATSAPVLGTDTE